MAVAIRYIKFIVDYDNFDDWKKNQCNCKTQVYIEVSNKIVGDSQWRRCKNDEDKLNIYEVNSKDW